MNAHFLIRLCLVVILMLLELSTVAGQSTPAPDIRTGGHSGPASPSLHQQLFTASADTPLALPPLIVRPPAPETDTDDEVLPAGLLYRSYVAAPHEPRMAVVSLYDVDAGEWRWDGILGGRAGLFRRNNTQFLNMDAWQIDIEGAVMTRLNAQQKMDVESADYRFGLLWTGQQGNTSWKFGYFHISSHVGDEFLISNPGFQRINYVRESLILGRSVQWTPELRTYGEAGWAFSVSDGAEPWQFQFGSEYSAQPTNPTRGAPYAAVNFQLRQETDFSPGITGMAGWQWTGTKSQHTVRVGLQYFYGPTNQYSFLGRTDNQIGAGLWYDY